MKFFRRNGYSGKRRPLLHARYEPTKCQNWLLPEEEKLKMWEEINAKKKITSRTKMLLIYLPPMFPSFCLPSLKGQRMDLDGVSRSISLPSELGSTSAWRTRCPRPGQQ
uniref:Uncharacterized protein n=1 Tax=Micrurus carvalhoi TaxID=3147026 RepID=A0A2H6MVZ1_9SAUR